MDNLIFLDLDEAIRADVARFGGTRDELSRRVCGSAQALRHKLAGFKGQFLRPDELIDLMLHSGGRHTVASMAAAVGGVFLMLPETVDWSPRQVSRGIELPSKSRVVTGFSAVCRFHSTTEMP